MAATNAAVNIKDTLADYQLFRSRLQYLSDDTNDYAQSMAFLTSLAEEHGKTIVDLGESYTSLSALRKGDLIDQQQQQQLMIGLSNAQSALGVSTDQLGNLMYGLGQALSQPTIQAQEFNQVMEPLPGLMQNITKAAGLQGKTYRDLVLEGKVTSTMFRDDLITALSEYEGAASANIDTITAQENALENLRIQTVAAFEEPINNVYGALLETTADSMTFLRDNADTLTTAIETLTAIALVRGAAAISTYGIELAKSTIEQDNATQSAVVAAKRQHELNLANQTAAQRSLAVASSDTLRANALTRLAKANQAVAASTAALNVATTQYTVVGRAATTVARGLWAALGGIPGVILLGSYALYEWASSSKEATNQTKELDEQVKALQNTLNPFSNYTRTQASLALTRYTGLLKIAAQQADEMRQRFNNPYFKTTADDVIKAEKEVKKYTDTVNFLQEVLAKGENTPAPTQTGTNTDDLDKSRENLLYNLKQQTDLYGQTGEAGRIAYETTYGALKKLSAEEKASLILAASKLDAKKAETDANRTLQAEVDKLLAKNEEEKTLYGDTSRVAQLRYDIEHGALQNVNKELRDKLLLQAQELDNMDKANALQRKVESIAAASMTPVQTETNLHTENITTLETYRDSLPETDLAKRQEINQLIEAEQQRHRAVMGEIQQQTNSEFDAMWSESFDRFASGMGTATADALFESENLKDGVFSVLQATGKQVVATLIEIGVKRLALAAINSTATATEATVASSAMAGTGAEITAAMVPAATATTLATAGTNGVGSIAAIGAVGAAMASMFAGFFDNGGNISAGKFGIAGEFGPEIVRGPAYVTSRKDTAKIFDNMGNGNSGGNNVVNYTDNSVLNVSGGSTDEIVEKVKPMLKAQKEETLAEVGYQFKRGRGIVYDGWKAAR
nr:tape measure protein [Alteromonas sp. C1M14]